MLECTYFFDILSQWCFIAEPAVAALRAKYGERIRISYRFVPIAFNDVLPVSRKEQAYVYKRSAAIAGVQTVPWIEEHEPAFTWEPNATVLAAARLGCDVDRVRAEIARAALIDGKPMGREGAAIAFVAERFGLDATALSSLTHGREVKTEMDAHEAEFKALGLHVRPSFLMRNDIGDHAILGGAYRFEVLDCCAQSLLDDALAYERFAAAHEGP